MVKSVEAIEERRQALMRDAWGAARAHKRSKISQAPRWMRVFMLATSTPEERFLKGMQNDVHAIGAGIKYASPDDPLNKWMSMERKIGPLMGKFDELAQGASSDISIFEEVRDASAAFIVAQYRDRVGAGKLGKIPKAVQPYIGGTLPPRSNWQP